MELQIPIQTVGMAYTTTQTVDSLLLHNLLFRNTANAPISSMYTLYANGKGYTYWDAAVRPADLSTLSTGICSQLSTFSTSLQQLQSTINVFTYDVFPSTQSTLESQIVSSYIPLQFGIQFLNNQFVGLSNQTQVQYTGLSNTLSNNINAITLSTLEIVTSTISGISSISTYTAEFNAVQTSLNESASTLSTTIGLGDETNYIALSTLLDAVFQDALTSSFQYADAQFSTLSSILVTSDDVGILSTQLNTALLSSSTGLANTIDANYLYLSTQLDAFEQSTISTQTWIVSTLEGSLDEIGSLQTLSTQLSSLTTAQISSYTSPLFAQQDTKFSLYTSTLQNEISTLSSILFQNTADIQYISSYTGEGFSTINSINADVSARISTLDRELSVLTTSSIVVGVYDSFIELYDYTVYLINSTVISVNAFQSTLLYSTTTQNTSTATGFFDAYVSTTFLSTVSTLVPITTEYVSTLTGSLYSTGSVALLSSINSSIFGTTSEYYSTTTSLTNQIVLSSQAVFNSSIAGYLSTPASLALINFSTVGSAALSTFDGQSRSTLQAQSTLFYSTYAVNQTNYTNQSTIGGGLLNNLSTSYVQYISTFSGLFSSITTSSITQFTTQNTQFQSTLTSFGNQFPASLASTNTAVLNQGVSSATGVLSNITSSTNQVYNQFVSQLNLPSVNISSFFTNQTITLTGTNYEGTMDFAAFTNFTVNVRAPLISGSSNYRVNYNSNLVSNLNYRRGIITVDVSTITSGYSNNNGRLCLDTYRWGLPTTMWNEFYPMISTSDYTSVYQYTILNNVVYTNLLNVFPRLRTNAITITTGTNTGNAGYYWRGTPVQVTWSNYSHFPLNAMSAPAYRPEVLVDVVYNNQVTFRGGPYTLDVSTATVNLPYITGAVTNPAVATIRSYIVGKPMEASETTVNVVQPQVYSLFFNNAPSKFLALTDVYAYTDAGVNSIAGTTNIFSYDLTSLPNSNFVFAGNTALYGKANVVDGNSGTVYIGGSNVDIPTTYQVLDIRPMAILPTLSSIVVMNIPATCNVTRTLAPGINDSQELQGASLRFNTLIGATLYFSTMTLTSSATQVFSM